MAIIDSIDPIGIVGAGTMGAGIAQVAAAAGHPVLLYDVVTEIAKRGIERQAHGLEKLIARGKMTVEERDLLISRIKPVSSLHALAPAKLVVEAIIEDLGTKRSLFSQLENICRNNTILTTNTSSISVTAIAAGLKKPERVCGMHFFNPAPVMRLVEVISGIATAPETALIVHELARSWNKSPVYASSTPGFIVNRVARPFYGEALRLLQEGVAPVATIDTAVRECGGFRMGPFELMDLIGIDINYAVTKTVYEEMFHDPKYRPSLVQRGMLDAGLLGQKSGRGFYMYPHDGQDGEDVETPEPDTAAAGPQPKQVIQCGTLGPAQPLVRLFEGAGIDVVQETGNGWLKVPGATLALTDGRTATQRSHDDGLKDLVVFDLALDYAETPRIVAAVADQADVSARDAAAGAFQAIGKAVSFVEDSPALIVMRTVCMLINEAADAVYQQVCNAADLDTAMQLGVNYPKGPLAWGDELGLVRVLTVMDQLACQYGDDHFRTSPLLRRYVAGNRSFAG